MTTSLKNANTVGGKVLLRTLANAPELVVDKLDNGNWEKNILCRIDDTREKFFVSVTAVPMRGGKTEYDVRCRTSDPFKEDGTRFKVCRFGIPGFQDLGSALACANGEGDHPLARETRPATMEEIASIPCFPVPAEDKLDGNAQNPASPLPPAEALGFPPAEEIGKAPAPVAMAYREFLGALRYAGPGNEAILCDSRWFHVARRRGAEDENLHLLEILFGGDPSVLEGFRKAIIEEHEYIESVPDDAGGEWCVEMGEDHDGPDPLRLFLQWKRVAGEAAGTIVGVPLPKVGREAFRFTVYGETSMPCSPDPWKIVAWEYGEGWVLLAKLGILDDDFMATLVPYPLGFVRADGFLKGICRLFRENVNAWSGATPILEVTRKTKGPWGRVGRDELELAFSCGYANFFGRGPWDYGDLCRWSEARLRMAADELYDNDISPVWLVHQSYVE